MFELSVDQRERRLDITLWGFWDAPTMDRFERGMIDALRTLRQLGRPTACLVDASIYPVQAREIAERHERLLAGLGDLAADIIAMVFPSQLVKLQGSRAAGPLAFRAFASRAEAKAWLHEQQATPRLMRSA